MNRGRSEAARTTSSTTASFQLKPNPLDASHIAVGHGGIQAGTHVGDVGVGGIGRARHGIDLHGQRFGESFTVPCAGESRRFQLTEELRRLTVGQRVDRIDLTAADVNLDRNRAAITRDISGQVCGVDHDSVTGNGDSLRGIFLHAELMAEQTSLADHGESGEQNEHRHKWH